MTDKTLKALQDHPNGITRRELVWQLTGVWTPDHDRAVRKWIVNLQSQGYDVISHGGQYFLLSDSTPPEAVRGYIARERAKAFTMLRRLSLMEQRFERRDNLPLENVE